MGYSDLLKLLGSNLEVSRLERQANLGWNDEFEQLMKLGLEDGMDILEVGSGPGFYTKLLLENLQLSHVTALEIDNKFLNMSKEYLKDFDSNRISFIGESILRTSIDNNKFDFIIIRFVIQHINEKKEVMDEIMRILKPGGIVVLIDSDKGFSTMETNDTKVNKYSFAANKIEKDKGWNRYCGRNLVRILNGSGFEDIEFSAVTIHSDLVGIENMIGKLPVNIPMENFGPILWINFIGKGRKPLI